QQAGRAVLQCVPVRHVIRLVVEAVLDDGGYEVVERSEPELVLAGCSRSRCDTRGTRRGTRLVDIDTGSAGTCTTRYRDVAGRIGFR
ncbi:MAG: hypothetical protein ACYDAG_12790, partial [Chloroflexota bacterium]